MVASEVKPVTQRTGGRKKPISSPVSANIVAAIATIPPVSSNIAISMCLVIRNITIPRIKISIEILLMTFKGKLFIALYYIH